jgi:hypothetical protein
MPDTRSHRGPAPADGRLFADSRAAILRRAASDLSWLLSRGYAQPGAVKLVGDRYGLRARQRLAVQRSVCSDDQLARRCRTRLAAEALAGKRVLVDGFNLVIVLESALGGAFLFVGRDGCIRDLAGLHGTYRIVRETPEALRLLAEALSRFQVLEAEILLDRPVSNSGRLKGLMEDFADEHGLPWLVRLEDNPDIILRQSPDPILTADSAVLDECPAWANLTAEILPQIPAVKCINLF